MKFNIDKIYWDKENASFTQDASTLGIPPGKVYKNITLFNPRTKGTCEFTFFEHIYGEDDVIGWKYKSNNLTLVIWND